MQYSFSNEIITTSKFEPIDNGFNLEILFTDFSCDAKSFKAVLSRQGSDFVLTLSGNETDQRCSQKFSAEISGIQPGIYWLRVIYKKAGQDQQVLYQQFTVNK